MKKRLMLLVALSLAATAWAHFQVVMPSADIVSEPGDVALSVFFTHPMEFGPVMEMPSPRQFGVLHAGKKADLLPSLKARKIEGKTAYSASYSIREPGDYVFYVEPAPYWEPAEKKWIVHHAKVVVNGLGEEEGWDKMVGLPVEIEPLSRPYGLWTGNQFRGIVRVNGQPQPFATVEVEYWNDGKKVAIPADPFITQVVKADANGVFSYAMPRAGWWGFAALVESEQKMKGPDGSMAPVETGGLIWVKAVDMK
jgi:cobalt/nickel transport protein